jgi:hypothetical protein
LKPIQLPANVTNYGTLFLPDVGSDRLSTSYSFHLSKYPSNVFEDLNLSKLVCKTLRYVESVPMRAIYGIGRACKPKMDFLDCCKAIAKRAKLNPETFYLHKFRATFATWTLWKQVDLKTVQSYLGHSDMESTMRYLKPAGHDHVREKMNSVWIDLFQQSVGCTQLVVTFYFVLFS